jgi:hypothetical protein
MGAYECVRTYDFFMRAHDCVCMHLTVCVRAYDCAHQYVRA